MIFGSKEHLDALARIKASWPSGGLAAAGGEQGARAMTPDDANTYERLHAWAAARQADEWAREFEVQRGTAWSVTLRIKPTPYTIDGAGHGYAPDLPTAANEALEMIEAERRK